MASLNANVFRAIQRGLLIGWLRPWAPYLERRGLTLPAPESERSVDYDKLAGVFIDPTPDMPAELVDSVFLIRGMANPIGMGVLLDGAAGRGVSLEVGAKDTPGDVAVKLWLLNPGLLEDLHNYRELTRPRAFQYFATDMDPVPAFAGPTEAQTAALEERLNRFYVAWHHGHGAKVFTYKRGDKWSFLIRHGAVPKRQGAMEDGQETSVFFRPLRHDVLLYSASQGENLVQVPVTNLVAKPEALAAIDAVGSITNTFLPGIGSILALALGGLYHGYRQVRNRKVNEALVQGVETARAVLTTTPQGQAADAQFVKWLMDHQKEAGVFTTVSSLVEQLSDNPAAKMTAQEIAQRVQQAQQQRTASQTPAAAA